MIDRSHGLPLARQAQALGVSRGSVYYLPRPGSAADLAIMRRINELYQRALRLTHARDSQAAENLIRPCRHEEACDGGSDWGSV